MPNTRLENQVILSGVCNLLMSQDNVRLGTSLQVSPVGASVAATGNWVGGRYSLTDTHLSFEMNGMNRKFQRDHAPTLIPLDQITGYSKGSMFWIAATVDVNCGPYQFRFRLAPGKYKLLLAELNRLCPMAN